MRLLKPGLYLWAILLLLMGACDRINSQRNSFSDLIKDLPSIKGRKEYLSSPYVTAGDRLYMIGYQDGTFPDLGWHIHGEMGGIWDHPVKLMDGFSVTINGQCLPSANEFVNYPVANLLRYNLDSLLIDRIQYVPDGLEAMSIEFRIKNQQNEKKAILFGFTGMADLLPVWLSSTASF